MDTLLIVENEEQVRKELLSLIKRSSVKIARIIECESGEEAFEIVQSCPVDLIFSSLQLPGMSGCELAEKISDMENPGMLSKPKIVVISGVENFQCAVELLKYGAKDYILKPVSFDAVDDVLCRMEHEIVREKKREQEIGRIYRHHIRNLLKNGYQEHEEVWDILVSAFEERRMQDCVYRLILTNPSEEKFSAEYIFFLDHVNGDLYFVEEDMLEEWMQKTSNQFCIGISQKHTSVCEIPVAYKEALEARKSAFIKGTKKETYKAHDWSKCQDVNAEIERFIQLFSSNKIETARKRFQNLRFEAKHQRTDPISLVDAMEEVMKRLGKNYENIYSLKTGGESCPIPLECKDVDTFLESFEQWFHACQSAVNDHTESVRKNDKILYAVQYIQENYQRDLNLAMVSNHVSMNYSMFSNAFKTYTGVNFVNYLKDIRIREAKKLLEETDEKIAEIGRRIGYGNDKHFMKTFKALCGVSPSEYRRNTDLYKHSDSTQKQNK